MVSPCKILLVDDQAANLLALDALLRELTCQPVACNSGEAALRELLRDEFAVILLDLQMPGMDGTEVARFIRERDRTKSTPIIFITAHDANAEQINDAYSIGAVDFLIKPINQHVLRAKVKFFVELHLKNQQLRDMEQQLHAAQLKASRERTRLILENAKDFAFIEMELDGTIFGWGAGAEHVTGWTEEEALGSNFKFMFTSEDLAAERPTAERQQAANTGRAIDKRWHVRKDGSRFFADGVTVAVYNEDRTVRSLAKIFQDATARVQAEIEKDRLYKKTQAASFRLNAVFEQAPAFLCTLRGPTHIFEMANERYYQLIDKGSEIIGRTVAEVLPEADAQGFLALLDKVYESGEPFVGNDIELSVRQKDGSLVVRIIDFVYVPLKDSEGVITGIIAHGIDITERKRLEELARSAHERYSKLVESMDEGFCVIEMIFDKQGQPVDYRFLEANPVFAEHTGLGEVL